VYPFYILANINGGLTQFEGILEVSCFQSFLPKSEAPEASFRGSAFFWIYHTTVQLLTNNFGEGIFFLELFNDLPDCRTLGNGWRPTELK